MRSERKDVPHRRRLTAATLNGGTHSFSNIYIISNAHMFNAFGQWAPEAPIDQMLRFRLVRTFSAFGRWAPEAPIDQTLRFRLVRTFSAFDRWAPEAPIDHTH